MRKMPTYRKLAARDLRSRQTASEEVLWEFLGGRKMEDYKFRRQRPLGRFIADFCCEELKLVLEIDGSIHDAIQQKEYDTVREEALQEHGYTCLRLTVE